MTIEYKDKGLNALIKALKGKTPVAKVGITGEKTNRKDGGPTNATIGLKHEFGQDGMPIRSFLRVPISDNLQKYLEKSGAFDEKAIKEIIAEKSLLPFVTKIGIVAESIVLEAFDTGGFGKWKPSDFKYKKVHQTLVETQQLRNSITSETK